VPTPTPKIEPAKVDPGQEATLFPWQVGNQWTYTYTHEPAAANQRPLEITWRVADLKKVANGTQATIATIRNNTVLLQELWLINDQGIYEVTASDTKHAFSTPQTVISFPVQTGKKFDWEGDGVSSLGGQGHTKSTSTILAPQEVDTDNGTYSAIPVESESDVTQGKLTGRVEGTVWFAPKVGIVKIVQARSVGKKEDSFVLKLKTMSLAKS
jgi:hypothetical protein